MRRTAVHGAAAAAMILALAASATPAAAQPAVTRPNFQTGSTTGIGYAAVLPNALAGAGVWHMFGRSKMGVFVDGKFTVPSVTKHRNYCPSALTVPCVVDSVQQVRNDFVVGDETEWLIFNGGGMYALSEEFVGMLGVGMARQRGIREYVDAEEDNRITEEGNYFVPHAAEPVWTAQLTAAMLVRAGRRLAFSFGYETQPGSMNIGVYVTLN